MKKGVNFLIIISIIFIGALIFFILGNKFAVSSQEIACINSGGTVTISSCCGSASDFPNSCTIGSCGCSPAASHEVKSCSCGTGMCFNGSSCVTQG